MVSNSGMRENESPPSDLMGWRGVLAPEGQRVLLVLPCDDPADDYPVYMSIYLLYLPRKDRCQRPFPRIFLTDFPG